MAERETWTIQIREVKANINEPNIGAIGLGDWANWYYQARWDEEGAMADARILAIAYRHVQVVKTVHRSEAVIVGVDWNG